MRRIVNVPHEKRHEDSKKYNNESDESKEDRYERTFGNQHRSRPFKLRRTFSYRGAFSTRNVFSVALLYPASSL